MKCLLTEAKFTLTHAVELAQGVEAAQKNAELMKGKLTAEGSISKITQDRKQLNSLENQNSIGRNLATAVETWACS